MPGDTCRANEALVVAGTGAMGHNGVALVPLKDEVTGQPDRGHGQPPFEEALPQVPSSQDVFLLEF